jgi:hypothetical protein
LIGTETVSGPVTRTLTFTADIKQGSNAAFNATFMIEFRFTEALYNQLVNAIIQENENGGFGSDDGDGV